jgi:hypothetical protein
MSITKEEALRMAGGCDIDNFPVRAAALRSLAAEREQLQAENEKLRAALRSIAANTCCDLCQEAALVARAALGEKE